MGLSTCFRPEIWACSFLSPCAERQRSRPGKWRSWVSELHHSNHEAKVIFLCYTRRKNHCLLFQRIWRKQIWLWILVTHLVCIMGVTWSNLVYMVASNHNKWCLQQIKGSLDSTRLNSCNSQTTPAWVCETRIATFLSMLLFKLQDKNAR